MRHILREDRWGLDFAAGLVFAAGMTVGFQVIGNSWDGGRNLWDRILATAGIAVASYTTAFLVGMAVRKYVSFVRSWVWMSMVGALVFTVVTTIIVAIPHWLEYYNRFIEGSGVSKSQDILSHLPLVLASFVVWAVSGAIFLIIMRYIVALIENTRPLD